MANWNTQYSDLKIDSATGVLTSIGAYINSADVEGGQNLLDDTGLGMSNESMTPGLGTATRISINGFLNSTTEAIFGPLVDGTSVQKTVELKHFTGRYHYGEVWPESVRLNKSPGQLQLFSATLVADAGLNRTSTAQV